MSTTTRPPVLLPTAPEGAPDPRPEGGPVLAVLLEDHPVDDVLERAGALAEARGTGVLALLLRARTPFSTDPALIARLVHRRHLDLDRLEQVLTSRARGGGSHGTELLVVPVPRARRWSHRAWSEVGTVARRRAAAVVVVPPPLAAAAAERAGRAAGLAVVVVGGDR